MNYIQRKQGKNSELTFVLSKLLQVYVHSKLVYQLSSNPERSRANNSIKLIINLPSLLKRGNIFTPKLRASSLNLSRGFS